MQRGFSQSVKRRSSPTASALLATFLGLASLGCQAVAPSSLAALTTSSQEKKILKQAAVDPFPSPADVGLSESTEAK
jgi:hypothetical protein